MKRKISFCIGFGCMVLCLAQLTACAPKVYKTHPNYSQEINNISQTALLPPKIEIYEISAGDVPELRQDWSEKSEDLFAEKILKRMKDKGVKLAQPDACTQDVQNEIEEIFDLWKAVDLSIRLHAMDFSPIPFEHKQKDFRYSVGSVENLLKAFNADALILLNGIDQISTQGRRVLMVTSVLTGVITGHQVMPGQTDASMAITQLSGIVISS
ncbi:MAG: hypothetical protein JEZ02_10140 [Desulfatibacillum sp.]|nr:hypothetical protein [Desulfatibacillum sp.]